MTAKPLVVASVYNRYLTRGGEDEAFEAEVDLLERNGVRVEPVIAQTGVPRSAAESLKLGLGTIWSVEWYRTIARLIESSGVDLIHVHNSFPVISPSIYYASRKAGIPVVQTLHNYRLICPSATLFRDGHACEDCVGKLPYPGIRHRCYHDSHVKTGTIAAMLSVHRLLRTWSKTIDAYIALSRFARDKFVKGGLPPEKLVIKPNFVHPDPGTSFEGGDFALYVGRLSQEKGIRTLLDAWRELEVPLRVIGDGPLDTDVSARAAESEPGRLSYLGRRSRQEVLAQMKRARFLVFPSEVYESFPITLVEAFACGLPVITTSHGAMTEIVDDGRTGLCFAAGDASDLKRKVLEAWSDRDRLHEIGRNARREYETKYTAEENFRELITLYERLLARAT